MKNKSNVKKPKKLTKKQLAEQRHKEALDLFEEINLKKQELLL